MAKLPSLILQFFVLLSVISCNVAAMLPVASSTQNLSLNVIWYGNFTHSQRAIVTHSITSLSSFKTAQPSVATWWNGTHKYSFQALAKSTTPAVSLSMGAQILDKTYSLGKNLTNQRIKTLASRLRVLAGPSTANAINVVLTASDVAVKGVCLRRCGSHGISSTSNPTGEIKWAYIWVGNSEVQCPGQCARRRQSAPLVAANNDVGLDGMVMNLASLLAGAVTKYQGPQEAPLQEAVTCPGQRMGFCNRRVDILPYTFKLGG